MSIKALTEQRIHQIKAWFHAGMLQAEVLDNMQNWPLTPGAKQELIDRAAEEMDAARSETEHQSKTWVMNELRGVYYRACKAEDISGQVSALSTIGKFCGLSEKQPYRGKLVGEQMFTDEEYERALQS